MKIDLDIGESLCPYCESGKIMSSNQSYYCIVEECSFCKGKGKLDWIEKVVGCRKKPFKIVNFNYQIKFSDLLFDWKKINV